MCILKQRQYFVKQYTKMLLVINVISHKSLTSSTSQAFQFYSNLNSDLPIRIQQCQQYADYNTDYDEGSEYLKSVEEQFSCSDVLLIQFIFFSDINAGSPTDTCYSAITEFAKDICIYIVAVDVSVSLQQYQMQLVYCVCVITLLKNKKEISILERLFMIDYHLF
ncbi:unnamed protein product [Paramecium sonneborni]|uniref:Uncharacterized protein n=1 Tax=Paramecium sonneborni TaxID=65129 RepID=A0A8S1RRP2_9CILI|nr:unnamed protein product [Paramecium sonneborni]